MLVLLMQNASKLYYTRCVIPVMQLQKINNIHADGPYIITLTMCKVNNG